MPGSRRNLNTLTLIRDEPVDTNVMTPAVCPDVEGFAAWTDNLLAGALTDPTHETLDRALLHLTKEYLYNRQGRAKHSHKGYRCFPDIYLEAANILFGRQMELVRRNEFRQPQAAISEKPLEEETQALFIGEQV